MVQARGYQLNFSEHLSETMYDTDSRMKKARTIVAVLADFFERDLNRLRVFDMGCSTGIMDNYLADYFSSVEGMDIDRKAVAYAQKNFQKPNLSFRCGDAMNVEAGANEYDIVICAHVYEHVPSCMRLLSEIRRILKPGGACYFAAGNKIRIREPHYKLPFLSLLPQQMADAYLRLTGKGDTYYEKHLTFWGLKKQATGFRRYDYTRDLIVNPEKFDIEYMLQKGSLKQRFSRFMVDHLYFLIPTYIWLLQKTSG